MNNFNSQLIKLMAAIMIFAILSPAFAVNRPNRLSRASLTENQRIMHVLNRLGFGARPGDLARVRELGVQNYIEQQLNPSSIIDSDTDTKVRDIEIFGLSTAQLFAKYPNPNALLRSLDAARAQQVESTDQKPGNSDAVSPVGENNREQKDQGDRRQRLRSLYKDYDLKPAAEIIPQVVSNRVVRAVYSERQLQEVMVDFWQNHFNVFAGKAAVRWYIPSYERDVLRKNALGNFKDLLIGTAQHPAMLFFLDNFESISPNAQQDMRRSVGSNQQKQKRGINENYARELMELHTLGVDGGYTQKDIIEVAKCFTGWTIADPRGYRKAAASVIKGDAGRRTDRLRQRMGIPADVDSGEFFFNSRWHENGSKTVLGQKVDDGGIKDGLKVLDILINSKATAKFIARKLCVKFVNDAPNEDLVNRVAEAFHRSRGDIKTTLRTLFTDKEFFMPDNYRAKVKTPFELAVSSIRALGAKTTGGKAMLAMLNKLGEVPYGYQAPTGYPDKAEDWVNTGALLERLNFAIAVASNRIPGTYANLDVFQSKDKPEVLSRAISQLLGGEISEGTRAMLSKQIEQPLPDVKAGPDDNDDLEVPNMRQQGRGRMLEARLLQPSGDPEVFKVVSLVLGSPDFQRQ
jgi:uncharacterized protein (DUF1800 family)